MTAADVDGAAAEVRRDPLHPRGVPEAAQSRPVRPVDRDLPGATAEGEEPRARSPSRSSPGSTMDYGPSLMATYEVGGGDAQHRLQGDRRPARPRARRRLARAGPGSVYDHDTLRFAAAWTGQGFIDWNGINFNGQHQVHPRIAGKRGVRQPDRARLGRPGDRQLRRPSRCAAATAGPTARCRDAWSHYRGLYRHGDRIGPRVHRRRGRDPRDARGSRPTRRARIDPVFTRTLNIGRSPHDLETHRRARRDRPSPGQAGRRRGRVQLDRATSGIVMLRVPAAATPVELKLLMARGAPRIARRLRAQVAPARVARRRSRRAARALARAADDPAVDRPRRRALRRRRPDRPRGQPLALPAAALGLRLPARRPHARRSAPGTATSGSSTGVDRPEKGLTWRRIASGLFQPLGLKIVDGRDLRLLPRPDRPAPRPERRRRDRLLRELQQRPPGDRALPRVRHGLADRRRGELLLRQGRPPRPARARAAPRHAPEGEQGRRPHRDPGHRLPRPQRRLPQPRRHVLRDRPGRVLDSQEPDQLGQARAASTATCGAITTSPTRPTRPWSSPSAGSPTRSTARRPSCSGSTARTRPGSRWPGRCSASRTATARSSSCRTRRRAAGCRGASAPCRSLGSRPA